MVSVQRASLSHSRPRYNLGLCRTKNNPARVSGVEGQPTFWYLFLMRTSECRVLRLMNLTAIETRLPAFNDPQYELRTCSIESPKGMRIGSPRHDGRGSPSPK